jgi:hypothetical protein
LKDILKFANAAVHLDNSDSDPETIPYRILFHLVTGQYPLAEKLIAGFHQSILASRDAREFSKTRLVFDISTVVECMKCRVELQTADVGEQQRLIQTETNLIGVWRQRFARLPNTPELLFEHLCVEAVLLPSQSLRAEWHRFFDVALRQHRVSLAESALHFVADLDRIEFLTLEARVDYA